MKMNRQKQLREQIQWKQTLPGTFTEMKVYKGMPIGIWSHSSKAFASGHFSLSHPLPPPTLPPPPVHTTSLYRQKRKKKERSRHTKELLNTHRHGKHFTYLLLVQDYLQEKKFHLEILNCKWLPNPVKCSHMSL